MTGGQLAYYLGAFALALGVLVVVHEMGHFLAARFCGVKVLRFSIGFGRPLLTRHYGADETEWAISAFPLGGYVKMLDERENPVELKELHRAFNRQSVSKRILIVVAGPMANLLLAILLYWVIFMQGMEELRPSLATPPPNTVAGAAAIQDGDSVRSINGKAIFTWQELRWELMQVALDRTPVVMEVINARQEISFKKLDIRNLSDAEYESDLPLNLGLIPYRPMLRPIIGIVTTDSVADRSGILAGDEFIAIDGRAITGWTEVSTTIRHSPGIVLHLEMLRNDERLTFDVTPAAIGEGGSTIGRLGVQVKEDPAIRQSMTTIVRYGAGAALIRAAAQTWDTSIFSLKMIGRMIAGDVSWKNLSGPVTIADYAGQSARMGWTYYLKFLALISISLGVLNLLPIPILDGGHLLYYIAEIIKGGPLSERIMEIGQQIGFFLLAMLMAFAFYNDINRLVSG